MAKTNYSFEKRQRELEKKRKAEEKRLRKQDGKSVSGAPDDEEPNGGELEPQPSTDESPTQVSD